MSTCTNWVTTVEITCKNGGSRLDYECTTWADEGYDKCTEWFDEGSNECTAWEDCGWTSPWDCIEGAFCSAWHWVAKWVCLAFVWVVKWVCKAFAWVVVHIVCGLILWYFVLFPIYVLCQGLTILKCAIFALGDWLTSLFGDGGGKPQIEHIFVLMLENRAFDHMLGFSGIERGFDPSGEPTNFNEGFVPNAITNNINPRTGANVPTSAPAEFYLKGIDLDPGHEFHPTLTALCGKKRSEYDSNTGTYPPIDNSGFVQNYSETTKDDDHTNDPTRVMHCWDEPNLPILNRLAREFAVCDKWFASMPGPTEPNRLFAMAASSGGLDDSPDIEWLQFAVATGFDGYEFENGTIFDALEANCNSWSIYCGDAFPFSFILKGTNTYRALGRFHDFDDFASDLNDADFGDQFVWIEPKYGAHDFDIGGPGDFSCGSSMHPLDDVSRGEALVKTVYETIRNSPHWEKSLLIITFDEHGGFYDHVPPGPAVPPNDVETQYYHQVGFRFGTLGVRVPAIVISPYTRANTIDHDIHDHASILATAERVLGFSNLTDRDKSATDVLDLLNLSTPRTDALASLPAVTKPGKPLGCEADDASTQDRLMIRRSELRIATEAGFYRDRPVASYSVPRSQVPFLGIALRQAIQGTAYADRVEWLRDFQAIRTGIDAALFMTEAKLKVEHGLDMKRAARETREAIRRRNRAQKQSRR